MNTLGHPPPVRRHAAAALSLLLIISACSGDSDSSPTTALATTADEVVPAADNAPEESTSTAGASDTSPPEGVDPGIYADLRDSVAWENGTGLTLSFSQIRVIDPERIVPADELDEMLAVLEEGTESFFILEDVTVSNATGATPHRWAQAASERIRSGLSPAATSSLAAVS